LTDVAPVLAVVAVVALAGVAADDEARRESLAISIQTFSAIQINNKSPLRKNSLLFLIEY